jgi:hypothetical protein
MFYVYILISNKRYLCVKKSFLFQVYKEALDIHFKPRLDGTNASGSFSCRSFLDSLTDIYT